MLIRPCTNEDLPKLREVFREYGDWVIETLHGDLCVSGFAKEIGSLPGAYAPPTGSLLLACTAQNEIAACVALRRFNDQAGGPREALPQVREEPGAAKSPASSNASAELKRLYVRPAFRTAGLGRALVTAMIDQARALGYRTLLLDTLPAMAAAIRMYRSLGFTEIPPYGNNPAEAICFRLDLGLQTRMG